MNQRCSPLTSQRTVLRLTVLRFFVVGPATLLFLSLPQSANAEEAQNRIGLETAAVGWASVEGGTTGGRDGPTVTVTDAAAFEKHVQSLSPLVIQVSGHLRLNGMMKIQSDKTIVGIGSDAVITGGGLQIRKVHNIIVRNLTIKDAPDAIDIEESHHVWIDHCDFSKCRDGLLDIKRGSDFITVSWNHFHDHQKTCLLGHSDKADIRKIDMGRLRVTYHHNFFDGTGTRHPRVRFAEPVHVFNNLFRGNEYGVASLRDAGVIVEGNYFENVERPTLTSYGDSPESGRLVQRNNVFVKSGQPCTRGTVDEPKEYYDYRLDKAEDVLSLVQHGAGVEKTDKRGVSKPLQ